MNHRFYTKYNFSQITHEKYKKSWLTTPLTLSPSSQRQHEERRYSVYEDDTTCIKMIQSHVLALLALQQVII